MRTRSRKSTSTGSRAPTALLASKACGVDAGERHRDGLAQAELALQAVDRGGDVADPVAARVEPQGDAGNPVRRQAVPFAKLAGAFDRRVGQVARGVVLE
jgi:hypothetical protein